MALQGNLNDLSAADLIQWYCQAGNNGRLTVDKDGERAVLYFESGEVPHAETGDIEGADAVYEVLGWESGDFQMEPGVAPPKRTIGLTWSALVMEGLRRFDERRATTQGSSTQEKEQTGMAAETRRDKLARVLSELIAASGDVRGAAIVGRDGLIIAADLPSQMDQARVGAVAAAILSLSGRSVGQLERGTFQQTLIQGSDGNIVITDAGKNAAFVALTGENVNLGMVFLEVREAAGTIAEVLG